MPSKGWRKRKNIPLVLCACGCGQLRPKYDKNGRQRYFIQGHDATKGTKAELTRIKKGQHLSSLTEFKKGRKAPKKEISKNDLVKLYWDEKKTLNEISHLFNMSIPTVSARMNDFKISRRDTKIKKEQRTGKTYEQLYGWEKAQEMKKKLSEIHRGKQNHLYGKPAWNKGKRWPSEVIRKILTRRTPNKAEHFLINLFKYYSLPYSFVGDGSLIIDGRNPDFINSNGQKKIIEFFGEHWHEPEDEIEKREIYNRYGFDLLVIWGKELKDEKSLLTKILDFNELKGGEK